MPHIVVDGPCAAEAYYNHFRQTVHKDRGCVLKTIDCYINHKRDEVLVDVVAVENGRPQSFFVSLLQRDEGVMVKLLQATAPEKTDGVKQMLVFIAGQVISQHADCRYGATNLQAHLPPTCQRTNI